MESYRMNISHNTYLGISLFIFWLLFATFSSGYDWDLSYVLNEIDLRGIFESASFPKWSYQYCGGITRAGDPNSIAESLWFLLPLILGSFWGVKLIVPAGMLVGSCFLYKFLYEKMKFSAAKYYVALINLNSFWVLHFSHGHAGYVSQFLFIVCFIYYYLYFKEGGQNNIIAATTLFYLSFSIGFYQVSIFMGIPVVISFLATFLFCLFLKKRIIVNYARVLKIFISILFVCVLSAHKLLNIMSYQKLFPRLVTTQESYGLNEILTSFFVPFVNEIEFLFNLDTKFIWGVHEYAYFSIVNWLLLFLCLHLLLRFKNLRSNIKRVKDMSAEQTFFVFLAIVSILFYMGDFSEKSPFKILNNTLFNGSIRVTSRYLLWAIATFNFTAFYIMERSKYFINYRKILLKISILISLINVSFLFFNQDRLNLSLMRIRQSFDSAEKFQPNMKYVVIPFQKYPRYAYHLVNQNFAILSCYTPLNYEKIFNTKFLSSNPRMGVPFFFLQNVDGTEIDSTHSCFRDSYFTQEEIFISKNCPDRLELRLTNVNPNKNINGYTVFKDYEKGAIVLTKK